MDNKNKDRFIIALVIIVIMLFANNLKNNTTDDMYPSKYNLLDNDDEIVIDSNIDDDSDTNMDPEMKVHISGEIKNPGVYTIKDGDRLDDLVLRAGGFTDLANQNDLNLALRLDDQMKIYIPNINEEPIDIKDNKSLISSPINDTDTNKININTASKEELMSLPNIGEKRAQAIIDYRQENLFESIEDIKNVTGIGDKFYQSMKDLIKI